MLYHISPISGLKTLQPRVSSHGKSYVYAVESPVMGLLFGARHDDFDLLLDEDAAGVPMVYECYPNALEQVYAGKSCFVYSVEECDFLRGVTNWEPELVCEHEVAVLQEFPIGDLYQTLLEEERRGRVKLFRYSHELSYRRKIAEHITDRIFRFELDLQQCMQQDARFAVHYRELVQALIAATDGHLLK